MSIDTDMIIGTTSLTVLIPIDYRPSPARNNRHYFVEKAAVFARNGISDKLLDLTSIINSYLLVIGKKELLPNYLTYITSRLSNEYAVDICCQTKNTIYNVIFICINQFDINNWYEYREKLTAFQLIVSDKYESLKKVVTIIIVDENYSEETAKFLVNNSDKNIELKNKDLLFLWQLFFTTVNENIEEKDISDILKKFKCIKLAFDICKGELNDQQLQVYEKEISTKRSKKYNKFLKTKILFNSNILNLEELINVNVDTLVKDNELVEIEELAVFFEEVFQVEREKVIKLLANKISNNRDICLTVEENSEYSSYDFRFPNMPTLKKEKKKKEYILNEVKAYRTNNTINSKENDKNDNKMKNKNSNENNNENNNDYEYNG
ncbi:hypothetical protein PIROE2DRAFT_5460, partial [Piromyces sp. E2]